MLRATFGMLTALVAVAGPVDASADSFVKPLPLAPFNKHFEWNSFCVVRQPEPDVPQTQVYKDLLTGVLEQKDNDQQLRLTARDNIFVDSRFNATTCSGPSSDIAWVQRISDAAEWQRMVRSKTTALVANTKDDSIGALWLLEIDTTTADARLALRALPRDVHMHRKPNSSTVYAMAYLTVAEARKLSLIHI